MRLQESSNVRRRGVHGRDVADLGLMDSYTPATRASIAEATAMPPSTFQALSGIRHGRYTVTRDERLYFISWAQ